MSNPVNNPDSPHYVSIERRRELAECYVTLNGMNATIAGVTNDFATVAQLPNGLKAEFAWKTVEHVIDHNNGDFIA